MTDKHTPGPWRLITADDEHTIHAPGHGTIIATAHPLMPECPANARLIAAAPATPHECSPDCPGEQNRRKLATFTEMLKALEKAMDDAWYNDDSNIERIEPEWIVQARYAIKAAREL